MYSKVIVSEEDCQKFRPFRSHNAENWRGPHQGIEMLLFTKSNKKVALVSKYANENWETFIRTDGLSSTWDEEFQSYIVTKDQDHNAVVSMFQRTKKMRREHKISWNVYSVRLGRLLGYTKHQIRSFIEDASYKNAVKFGEAA
jgi:hypothetical protein